jgi:hypothetical protein
MYDTSFFKDNHKLLDWAKSYLGVATQAKPCVGWDGPIKFAHMSKELLFLYQLERKETGLEVVMFHMLLWSEPWCLRENIFRVRKFFRPDGEMLWHSAIAYEDRMDLPFAVVNAWQEDEFAKYSEGGCFEMAFSGIGDWLVCNNDKGTIRFFDGNPVERMRKEKNDPTIDHVDMYMTEARMLNPGDDSAESARAEFAAIVENCETMTICGEKCYRLHLWSGPMDSPASFPWTLLVAANRVEGHYVPRTGDMVHGNAFLFGTFIGDAREKPTVHDERTVARPAEESACKPAVEEQPDPENADENEPVRDAAEDDAAPDEADGDQKGWEWLPRPPAEYPECEHHGGGLHGSVKKIHPKFVVYADYRRHLKGELTPVKLPSRKALKRILDSIDYVLTQKNNERMFADCFDAIGIRHMVRDAKTGENHLWCCLPSGIYWEHFRSNLLIALDGDLSVLRYTFHAGEWNWMKMDRGMAVSIHFQSSGNLVHYDSIPDAIPHLAEMKKDDYLIAAPHGPTALLQAWCDESDGHGNLQLLMEWHVHGLPWQFNVKKGTREQFAAMLEEFDKHGVEAVQTMAKWRWCKMKGNW